MVTEEALKAALVSLYGRELEVLLRLLSCASKADSGSWRAVKRYRVLAKECSPTRPNRLSSESMGRTIRSLRQKGWISVPNHPSRNVPTEFLITIPGEFKQETDNDQQPAYESFSKQDRDDFLLLKTGLGEKYISSKRDQAREYLSEQGSYSDAMLRDKTDELIMKDVFGPLRWPKCMPAFSYLYKS